MSEDLKDPKYTLAPRGLKAFSLNKDLIFTLFLAQRLQKTWNMHELY